VFGTGYILRVKFIFLKADLKLIIAPGLAIKITLLIVRFGSLVDIPCHQRHVRFASNSGHLAPHSGRWSLPIKR